MSKIETPQNMWVLKEDVQSSASTFGIFPFDIFLFGPFKLNRFFD